jgi:ABC-type multidrug transport system permease subunit
MLSVILLFVWRLLGIIVGVGLCLLSLALFLILLAAVIKIGIEKVHETHI